MSTVRIPMDVGTRGQFTVSRYEFELDVRFEPTDSWRTLPCVIDTAARFTIISRVLLGAAAVVPKLTYANPPRFGKGDYPGAFWYRFPAQFASSQVRPMEFRCDVCQVTNTPSHFIHLALRDIRPNFYIDSDHQTDALILALRPINLGLVYGSGS